MEKLEKIKKKITMSNVIMIYIIMQPIIDFITSLYIRNISTKFTIGMLLRASFMVVITIYTILNIEKKEKRMLFIYLALVIIYTLAFTIDYVIKFQGAMIFAQIKGLIKILYFPVVLVCMLLLLKHDKIQIKEKFIYISLLIYVLPIILCKYFSIGYYTYKTNSNLGTIGLFFAGNEISAILPIFASIYFSKLTTKNITAIDYVFAIAIAFAMLEIGTKVAGISIYALEILATLISFIHLIRDKRTYKQFLKILSIFIVSAVMLGNTSFGKNYQIKPLIFNETVFKDKKITQTTKKATTTKTTTQVTKTQSYADKVIEKPEIVLSGRDRYLKNNIEAFGKATIIDKFVGIGYYEKNNDAIKEIKLVEIDYFDIFICHGFLGAIIIIAPFIIFAALSIKRFFKDFKKNIKNTLLIFSICAIVLAFGVGMIAGHVFTAPAVSTALLVAIFIMCNELNNKGNLKYE